MYRGRSVEELSRMVSDLCRSAARAIDAQPSDQRILDHVDPRTPESEQLWLRLFAPAHRR